MNEESDDEEYEELSKINISDDENMFTNLISDKKEKKDKKDKKKSKKSKSY